ncbi:MAG: caspase family protein [Burkholderiaceae bacterium]
MFSNGNQFVGGFDRDLFSGPGIEYSADGSILRSGTWGQDRLLVSQALDPARFPWMSGTSSVAGPGAPQGSKDTQITPLAGLPACPVQGVRHLCNGEEVLADGSRYRGEFRGGSFDGFGSLDTPMAYYIGEFRAGQYHGLGVLYTRTGQILGEGRWERGERVQSLALDRSRFPFTRLPATPTRPPAMPIAGSAVTQPEPVRDTAAASAAASAAPPEAASGTATITPNPVPGLPGPADRRVALVVGNSTYTNAPLNNPINDANDMAAKLRSMGFEVMLRTNLNRAQMRAAVREFGEALKRKEVGLFYFAGHGIESKGRNFLIPVAASLASEFELEDEAVDANAVLRAMEDAGNPTNILILDACRDNPFARSWRSGSRGLAPMNAPAGSFIAFATAPGSVAADGTGRNGTFTKHLLASLGHQDLDIDRVFTRVTAAVANETGRKQIPWKFSSLTGEFSFGAR